MKHEAQTFLGPSQALDTRLRQRGASQALHVRKPALNGDSFRVSGSHLGLAGPLIGDIASRFVGQILEIGL